MANNEYVNEVKYGGQTIISLKEDTVTPATLMRGETAHDRSGAPIVGTATGGGAAELNDLDDVTVTSPSDGDILRYDSSDEQWKNESLGAATTATDGLMSSSDKVKLNGIASGAEVNVQSDWNVTDSSSDAFIKNKPTIPTVTGKADKVSGATNGNFAALDASGNLTDSGKKASDFAGTGVATTSANGLMSSSDKTKLNGIATGAEVNVQSDWNVTDSSSDAFIKNKPSIPAAQVNSDWNATSGVSQILNKPTIPAAQIQSDWNQTNTSAKDFIKNKPTIPSVTNKADKVSGATSGNFAGLDVNGNLTDSGKKASDFATSSHTHSVNQITWAGGQNLSATASANGQEWSIDLNPSTYTGTYFHVWSSKNSKSILSCFPDDNRVEIPNGTLTLGNKLIFNNVTNAIAYKGTKATYDMIKFKDNTNDEYGNGVVIGGGGLTVVGGGEAADSVAGTHSTGGDEVLDLASDGDVYVWANVQNGATSTAVKKFRFGSDGHFRVQNGYAYASYLNQSSGAETPTGDSYWMYCNSDGFLRKSTRANLENLLYPYEAKLQWGGNNFADGYSPIDAAMVPFLGANRLACCPAGAITVEYSRDNGSTWTNYSPSDIDKRNLFTTQASFGIGKNDSSNKATANGTKYQLRVTIDTGAGNIYSVLNKFVVYVSTSGSWNCTVRVQKALQSSPTSFVDHTGDIAITGWSGYNVINCAGITTYGNTASRQYGRLRFLFKANGGDTNYNGMQVLAIYGFGGVGWNTPSAMAKHGHIYNFDGAGNASFPANLTFNNGKQAAYHSATPTSGQVVVTDGTSGGIKSSGYTIAKSVPSDAVFTDHTYSFSNGAPSLSWGATSTVGTVGGTALTVKMPSNPNTWRGIQDNLTSSTNTTESLSAKQGYLLANGSARDNTKLPLTGGNMTGTIRLKGADIALETSGSSSNDSGDITWWYGNGKEKARLWTNESYTAETGLNFRMYKEDGTQLFTGQIPLRDTNTWRGIQDNLTSSSNTSESLSAKQGYLLANGSARDSTKLPLAGGKMTGTIKGTDNTVLLDFRDNDSYHTTASYQTAGNEALVFATKMAVTSFMFVNGEDSTTNHASDRWQSLTPALQIKNNCVSIGKLIGSGVNPTHKLEVNGSVAEGSQTTASGSDAHAEGFSTCASGTRAHTEGAYTVASNDTTHAEGYCTCALGDTSHAEGYNTCATGTYSHAEGYKTNASGLKAHAEGNFTCARGDYSHAEGNYTYSAANASHAEGYYSTASGSYSHAEGYYTRANNNHAHAEGSYTTASGDYAHAEGYKGVTGDNSSYYDIGTKSTDSANRQIQHAIGVPYAEVNRYGKAATHPSDSTTYNGFSIDSRGSIFAMGAQSITRGICDGVLIAKTGNISLEPGAMYLLFGLSHLKSTGAKRGMQVYALGANWGIGTTTTAQAAMWYASLGAQGTVGMNIKSYTTSYTGDDNKTHYSVQLGIGSCTTNCYVRWSLMKVLGSCSDFAWSDV